MLFMNRLSFHVLRFLKPEKSMIFFKIRQQKVLWTAWSKWIEFFDKLMSKNSISGYFPFLGAPAEVYELYSEV